MRRIAAQAALAFLISVALAACAGASRPPQTATPPFGAATSALHATAGAPSPPVATEATPRAPVGARCGVERWPVKTLSDGDAWKVNFTPVSATVAQLRGLPPPASLPQAARASNVEMTTYFVTARIVGFKLEQDRDIHVVIADLQDASQTMIVEFADASSCSGAVASVHRAEMEAARAALVAAFGPPSASYTSVNATGAFTGVGFFDVPHGQTGVAPNAIELHPVLSFTLGSAASQPQPTAPPPAPAAAVTFTAVQGAPPGGSASVSVQTTAGASCTIVYVTPAGTTSRAQGLYPKTTDSTGAVTWSWRIGSRTRPGTGSVTVTCGGASESAPIRIG